MFLVTNLSQNCSELSPRICVTPVSPTSEGDPAVLAEFDLHARAIVARLAWAPAWLVSLIVFAVALFVATAVHRLIVRGLARLAAN